MMRRQFIYALALALLMVLASSSAVTPPPPPPAFRCQRPFAAVDTFTQLAKTPAAINCDFTYFDVLNATVHVHCDGDGGDGVAMTTTAETGEEQQVTEEGGCRVAVQLKMRAHPDAARLLALRAGADSDYFGEEGIVQQGKGPQKQEGSQMPAMRGALRHMLFDSDDVWRYSIALKAKGESTVHYKGFDGQGYSVCCDMVCPPPEGTEDGDSAAAVTMTASCPWMRPQMGDNDMEGDEEAPVAANKRLLKRCPLPLPRNTGINVEEEEEEEEGEKVDEVENIFYGRVTKPVHRVLRGATVWEARIEMWRLRAKFGSAKVATSPGEDGREVLGKIIVPFTIPAAAGAETVPDDEHKYSVVAAGEDHGDL